jgi:hypothetical protein
MKLTANHSAGILYLLAGLTILGMWYAPIFIHNPPSITPQDNLLYFLGESAYRRTFQWLFVLPVLCLLLAFAYFSKWTQTRIGTFSLFGMGVVLAFAAWLTAASWVAIFVSLPLWYGFITVRQHQTSVAR